MSQFRRSLSRLPLVPRTKVNYGWSDLIGALWRGARPGTSHAALCLLLGELFDTPNIILTASGRGALFLLMKVLPQPRIVIPSYTCKAVVEAAMLAGKVLVYVETEADGYNIDVNALGECVDADSVFIATHQFGIPCDIVRIMAICRQRGCFVIEDVAPALGSRINGRLAGSFGDAAFFSFDSTKLINVPMKSGFLLVYDDLLFASVKKYAQKATADVPTRMKLLWILQGGIMLLLENHLLYRLFHNIHFRWRGKFTDDDAELRPQLGAFYRFGMSEWQAHIALAQVRGLDAIVACRRISYAAYRDRLAGLAALKLPPPDENGEWACIRFPVRISKGKLAYYEHAVALGIDFAFSFTFIGAPRNFRRAHQVASEVLNVPFYYKLSKAEMQRVIDVLQRVGQGEE